jgi:hypothetical protein
LDGVTAKPQVEFSDGAQEPVQALAAAMDVLTNAVSVEADSPFASAARSNQHDGVTVAPSDEL